MINDPSIIAILQARRNFNARNPNGITRIDPIKPPIGTDPPEPVQPPNQTPQMSRQDRAIARQQAMNNYMRQMGLQGYRYGAGNVRTGNTSVGSDGAGYTALAPGALPVNGTPPPAGGPLRTGVLPTSTAGVPEPTLPQDPRNGTGGGGGFGAI